MITISLSPYKKKLIETIKFRQNLEKIAEEYFFGVAGNLILSKNCEGYKCEFFLQKNKCFSLEQSSSPKELEVERV